MEKIITALADELGHRSGALVSRAATQEDSVYRLYYDFSQALSRVQGHQVLAVNRGEKEKFLKVSVELDHELAMQTVYRAVVVLDVDEKKKRISLSIRQAKDTE